MPVVKEDGDFTVVSISPFVPIPDTRVDFDQSKDGYGVFLIQAVFGSPGGGATNGQIGISIDGVEYPLTPNLIKTMVAGVTQFLAGVSAHIPVALKKGSHFAELLVRGDSTLPAPIGLPVTVQANPEVPLALTAIYQ